MFQEDVEETTEGNQNIFHSGAAVEPQRRTSKTQYTGSLCGTTMVPERVETPTGIRYKCPQCEKFMKPLSKKKAMRERKSRRDPCPP